MNGATPGIAGDGQLAAELTGTIVRTASHELKNLLTGLSYATETAIASIEGAQVQTGLQLMNRVLGGLSAAHQRFSDLLTADRLLEGRWPWRTEAVPSDLLSDRLQLRLSAHNAADRGRVRLHLSGDSVANVDLMLVDFVWGILLSNALKFSDSPALVEVHLRCEQPDFRLQVMDRGIGIPLGECHQKFSPGFRLGNSGNRQGAGLGLYLGTLAASVHFGSVTLQPRPEGGSVAEAVFKAQ